MTESASNVFRDFNAPGVPASGEYSPEKVLVRRWGRGLEAAISAGALTDGTYKATKTALDGDLAHTAGAMGVIYADPVAANNGIYTKVGGSGSGSWTQVLPFLPGYQFIELTDVGAGSANAIQAISLLAPPGAFDALLIMRVFRANTGPATLAVNGGTAKPIKTNSGNDLQDGYFGAGMLAAFVDDGTNYRLLTDVASAAIQAASEEAVANALLIYGSMEEIPEAREGAIEASGLAETAQEGAEAAELGAEGARDAAEAAAAVFGATPYADKATMDGVTPGTLPAYGYVYDYAVASNNGLYIYPSGGSAWEKDSLDLNDRLEHVEDNAALQDVFETLATGVTYILDEDEGQLGFLPQTQDDLVDLDARQQLTLSAGDADALAERLDRGLTAYGDPKLASYLPPGALRNVRKQLRRLKDGTATQVIIALFGDSWVQGAYWILQFAKKLQGQFGFAGLGWVGFQYFGAPSGTWVDGGTQPSGGGSGGARTDLSGTPIFSGPWTSDNGAGGLATPSIGSVKSSTTGAFIRNITFPAGHTSADLYFDGDGTGVVRYSWDNGSAWSADLSLTETGPAKIALSGVPDGTGTFRIEVVSGNVEIVGINMKSTATGVMVHKLGASGSNSTQWAAVDAAVWADLVNSLGPHLVIGLLGTNDQSGSLSPASFEEHIAELMAALKTESPAMDRLWLSPAENTRANAVPMTSYAAAARKAAVDGGFAFHDLQYDFGDDVDEYKYSSTLSLLDSSDLHPAAASGGALISDAVLRLLAPL